VEGAALCAERLQMGIDRDGCFAALTAVPADRLVALPEASDNRAGAYAEPVAAALGAEDVLPEGARVGLFGDNRIASLTERLLVRSGRRPVRTAEANSLDFALESSAALPNLEQAMVCLRPEGTLVVKSRPPGPVAWPLRLQVEKRLKVLAAGYGSFQRAVVLVSEHPELFKDLWSDPLTLEAWPELFARERSGQETRKAFLLPNPA
jgi:threonine dehydrogenase-like Zn-dependent dehydrogenase